MELHDAEKLVACRLSLVACLMCANVNSALISITDPVANQRYTGPQQPCGDRVNPPANSDVICMFTNPNNGNNFNFATTRLDTDFTATSWQCSNSVNFVPNGYWGVQAIESMDATVSATATGPCY